MIKRLVTSIFLVLGLIVVLLLHNTVFFNIAIAALAIVGIHEIIGAFKFGKKQEIVLFSGLLPIVLFIFLVPFNIMTNWFLLTLFLTAMYFVLCIVFAFPKFDFSKISGMLVFSGIMLASFYSWIYLKELFPRTSYRFTALYFIVLGFSFSWGSDTMAYLTGMLFGKHKLAPVLSPKKTIEGAIGGVAGGVLIAEIVTLIFSSFFIDFLGDTTILYVTVAIVGVLATSISIVGDLFASAIKRQMDIKDYGTIFPGHGGVLDRFDSLLFVMPMIVLFAKLLVSFASKLWH